MPPLPTLTENEIISRPLLQQASLLRQIRQLEARLAQYEYDEDGEDYHRRQQPLQPARLETPDPYSPAAAPTALRPYSSYSAPLSHHLLPPLRSLSRRAPSRLPSPPHLPGVSFAYSTVASSFSSPRPPLPLPTPSSFLSPGWPSPSAPLRPSMTARETPTPSVFNRYNYSTTSERLHVSAADPTAPSHQNQSLLSLPAYPDSVLLDLSPPDALQSQFPALSPSLPPPSSSHDMSARFSNTGSGGSGSSASAGRREPPRPDENSRIIKRRRLDADKAGSPPFKGFRYGRYGQVEPGSLTMEIVSCDGGMYSANGLSLDGSSIAAENILKRDSSVYCTKANRCNIVLQHQGCTTFSLKELIIMAPGRGRYSSPVQEGMVFLSMTKDELFQAGHYDSYIPRANRSSRSEAATRSREATHPHSSSAALDDNNSDNVQRTVFNFVLQDRYGVPDPASQTDADADADVDVAADVDVDDDADATPDSSGDLPPDFPPSFRVMTECSDEENDEALGRSSRWGPGSAWRNRPGWAPPPLRARQVSADYPEPTGIHLAPWNGQRSRGLLHDEGGNDYDNDDADDDRLGYNDNPTYAQEYRHRSISSPPPEDDHGDAMAGGSNRGIAEGRTAGGLPCVRFSIKKYKDEQTIYFDPPVTARYILLKMWNPRHDGNIDIRAVVAKGFAGPRYFPAVEMR